MRQPDISRERIAFIYAGDLWTAPRTGGAARRLTATPKTESFPKFSPDGKEVKLSVNKTPSGEGAWEIVVKTIADEASVRYADWVRANRARVTEATGGKVGYIPPDERRRSPRVQAGVERAARQVSDDYRHPE